MKRALEQIIQEHKVELVKIGNTKSRFRKRFSSTFKSKIVRLVNEGEKRSKILDALQITAPTLSCWIKDYADSGKYSSFKELKVQDSDTIKKSHSFTIETPSGFQIKLDTQQDLVSIIKALETAL